jgi:iron complex transport system permease protein
MGTEEIEVLMISRLPRLISILVAGVGMSISGVIMQQLVIINYFTNNSSNS